MSSTMEDHLDQISDTVNIVETRSKFSVILAEERAVGRSLAKMAPEVGIPYSTLAAFANGKYDGDNVGVALKIERWLVTRLAQAKNKSTVRRGPGFMRTKTASRIFEVLEYTQMTPDMSVISGIPGVGKTTAINAYAANGSNVWVVTAEPAINTISALLEMLAEAVGVDYARGSAAVSRALRRKMASTHGLLIVDEAQHLTPLLRDQLRSTVHDAAEIGVALVGNSDLKAQFARERATGKYAQLVSRVGQRLDTTRPFKSDVNLLLDGWGLTGEEAREVALGVAMKPGALRQMGKTLRIAFALAAVRVADEPNAADIEMAWKQLEGTN